ncbi:MAG: hypothetical protein JWP91_2175 [Fibrobacteres bacterium]|nr:hypothetical protein [Fibrobacterota bacterium]
MRANRELFSRGFAAAALVFTFYACSGKTATDPVKEPDPVDKGNPIKGLSGILVDQTGTPLKSALVKSIPVSNLPLPKASATALGAIDSVTTDGLGRFVFTGLPKGTYNILGDYDKGKLVVLIKGIEYDGGDALLELKNDTLRAPGRISGRISFGEGDSGGVVCSIAGTSFATVSGDSGAFSLTGIPQGTYAISYLKKGLETVTDTGIAVFAGGVAKPKAGEMEADPAFPPPAPLGFEVAYDTLTGKATLRWRKVKVDDLSGYLLYRNTASAGEPTRLGPALIKDTAYVDNIFASALDSADKEYTYRIKAQDAGGASSPAYSKSVTLKAAAPSKVRTTFIWKITGGKGDTASIGDSISVTATWSNPTRKTVKLAFSLDAKESLFASFVESAPAGTETVKVSSGKAALRTVFAEATDEAGSAWRDSLSLRFVTDAPVPEAGKDTSAPIHTKIHFAGSATQAFGTIAIYKWDFDGDGIYDDSSAAGAASHVYDHAANYFAKLLVRDDDGNENIDFRNIEITNQAPKVNTVRGDTTVTINDVIRFTGTGSDTDGTVKGYGWDFDGNGTLDSASAIPFAPTHAYAALGVFSSVFRVTDDDGLTAQRIVKVTVIKDPPTANAGADTTVSIKDTVRLHGSGTDKYGTITAWAWDFGGTGTFKAVSKGDTSITAPASAAAVYRCILRVTDDDGNISKDTVVIKVLKDDPVANAGNDTLVSIGDAVKLSGKGTDAYGTLIERAWDVGATGAFKVTGNGDTTVFAPTVAGTFACSLRVTDDDGNTSKDVMVVTVVKDAPVAKAGSDTTVAVGLALTLTGSATQDFGTVAMYKWDWQDNGSWDDSSATMAATTFTISQGGPRTVLFGVRDDDGNFTVDTVIVSAVSYVGGTVLGFTIFSKPLSPYVLTSDLVVNSTGSLVISAGVDISGPYKILIKGGNLTAVGIEADSVIIRSPIRFEGADLSISRIGFARMSSAIPLQVGNNSLGSGVTQNSGPLHVGHSSFGSSQIVAEAFADTSSLALDTCRLDATTLTGTGPGMRIYLLGSSLANALVQTSNQFVTMDSTTAENTTFNFGSATRYAITNSAFTASAFKPAGGTVASGPLTFRACGLSESTVDMPNAKVDFSSTTINFTSAVPLIRIGLGTLSKAKFVGAGTGTGLEVTGYDGGAISGATTIDSSEVNGFNIGMLIRDFGSLAITGTNFVNSISYDLENQSPHDFNATDSYWSGANSFVNINTRIRDQTDDAAFGKVTFSPWSALKITF